MFCSSNIIASRKIHVKNYGMELHCHVTLHVAAREFVSTTGFKVETKMVAHATKCQVRQMFFECQCICTGCFAESDPSHYEILLHIVRQGRTRRLSYTQVGGCPIPK
jgi:hypothetical protein